MMLEHLKKANIKFERPQSEKEPISDWFAEQINNFRRPIIFSKGDRSERTEG
jgi:hypothetical protein